MFGRPVVALGVLLALSACESPARSSAAGDSGPSEIPAAILNQAEPIPRDEPLSASGNAASYVVFGETYHRLASAVNYKATGVASWYGRKFHGRATASGETYDMYSLTAAHRTLPLPTYVRVTNLDNQKSVVVRVNDRGPFVDDRLIDLSFGAAAKLDMVESGTARVSVVGLTGVPGEASASGHAVGPASGSASGSASGPASAPTLPYRVPTPILTPSSLESAQVNGNYLQVGAFTSIDAAQRLTAQLEGLTRETPVFITQQSADDLYRVRLGPFDSIEGASRVSQLIQTELRINPVTIAR